MEEIHFNKLNNTKKNHFIARSYLKLFTANNSEKILTYDIKRKKAFSSNINNIGAENKLYVIENSENKIIKNWEEFYTKLVDNDTVNVISEFIEIVRKPYVRKPLSISDIKKRLALIIIMQTLRIPARIYSQKDIYFNIANEYLAPLEKSIDISHLKEVVLNDMYYKNIIFTHINKTETISKYIDVIMDRTWIVYENNTKLDFIIGDNPAIIYDFVDKVAGIQNGIASDKTMISFPISPRYLIAIFPKQYLFGKLELNYFNERIVINEENIIKTYNNLQFKGADRFVFAKNKQELDSLLEYCS